MDVELLLKLAFIGVSAGLLSGLFGVGGGIILVPMLVWAVGMTQVRAQGTSLAAIMLLPMGLIAVLHYHRHGNVDFRTAGIIALFFLAGSWVGARLANAMNLDLLRKLFALLLAAAAVKLFFFKK